MSSADTYITHLRETFEANRNATYAARQSAYMRHQFIYFGMNAPLRRAVQKPFLLKKNLPEKSGLHELIHLLWEQPERNFQMFGLDLMKNYLKTLEPDDVALFEHTITTKSWWDTVDFIAANMLGTYFKKFPEQQRPYVDKWLASGNIWLQRSTLLFQLGYKDLTDTKLLSYAIRPLLGSKEFFINKAIGWILRQYGKSNPDWVISYVHHTPELANLSKREALKRLGHRV